MKQMRAVGFFFVLLILSLPSLGFGQEIQQVLASAISTDGYVKDQLVVIFADGPAYFFNRQQNSWKPLSKGQLLINGDAVRTGMHGWLVLADSTDNLLHVKAN